MKAGKIKKPKRKEESREPEKSGAWSEDQRERGYYYDDAHGYRPYKPEHKKDSDDETEKD